MEILEKGKIIFENDYVVDKCNHCREEWCMCPLDDGC